MNLAVNFRLIFNICGWVAFLLAASMLAPLALSWHFADGQFLAFLKAIALVFSIGLFLVLQGQSVAKTEAIKNRDGLAAVALAWLCVGILGATPYWFSGVFSGWDGIFESFSGFSTTGATVATDIEAISPSILFWRAETHWLGGMGIVVLMLAILPFFGLNGVQLFKNENTLGGGKLKPTIAKTAKILWLIYLGLTALLIGLLLIGGVGWFDAICHAFSTISTGGFSNKNDSIGYYNASYVQVVIGLFMLLGSLNFAFYYRGAQGDWKSIFTNTESRVFLTLIMLSTLAVTVSLTLAGLYPSFGQTVQSAFFQVVSIISTTGFITVDWDKWPHFSQGVLFMLFFVGGSSGSTSGGLKCVRWILLFKGIHRTLRQHIHPRAVLPVRMGGRAIPEELMTAVWSFFAIYFIALTIATLSLTALGLDIMTSFSAAACAIGNVGLSLGEIGPTGNFAHLPASAKGILSFCMFLGRLEFFALMILFLPEFWRK
ncbi:MAG: TrkH family potassium uptake protein [Candidatus Adiutrix sp.]